MKWNFVLLGLLVFAAQAQSPSATSHVLRKCVGPKGAVSYQNDACAAGFREVGTHSYTPENEARYDAYSAAAKIEADRQAIRRDNARRGAYQGSGPQGTQIGLANDPDRCDRAKAQRKAAFDANWRHRTVEFSRSWDDYVRRECR